MNYNGSEYFYITNLQGDVIELVDINGSSVVKYKYDAWGNIIYQTPNQTIGDINPFRYRSYYFDEDTGLYYLQSRYYDPEVGRFISADGFFGSVGNALSHNAYAYCENNPVMYVDPEGEFLLHILVFAVVVLFLGTTIALTPLERKSGENISITYYASPDPYAFGFEFLGEGVNGQYVQDGTTCDLYGVCNQFDAVNVQRGLLGTNISTSNGETSVSHSFSVFYISYDPYNLLDVSSWGGGISLGFSGGAPGVGSGGASLDVDIIGIIMDFLGVGSDD
ncbi:MAG: RHS repeat-associated core domain-containing protein [Vulcanibacillus sp.]